MTIATKILHAFLGLTFIMAVQPHALCRADDTADAINRNTKALEENNKLLSEQKKGEPGPVGTVARWTGQAILSLAIWKAGEGLIKVFSRGGPNGAFIIMPKSVLEQIAHPGGNVPEACNVTDSLDPKGNRTFIEWPETHHAKGVQAIAI